MYLRAVEQKILERRQPLRAGGQRQTRKMVASRIMTPGWSSALPNSRCGGAFICSLVCYRSRSVGTRYCDGDRGKGSRVLPAGYTHLTARPRGAKSATQRCWGFNITFALKRRFNLAPHLLPNAGSLGNQTEPFKETRATSVQNTT